MRVLSLLALLAVLGGGWGASHERPTPSDRDVRLDDDGCAPRTAQLASSAAGIFLRLVNERLKGRIDPRSVTFEAPAGLVLLDTVLTGPGGAPVARIKRARVELSLRALFAGEIAISRLEAEDPRFLLEVIDGKLNLLEALSPRVPPDEKKPAEGAFRIDDIRVTDGGLRLRDGENVTVVADDIDGRARLDVDLARDFVLVDVSDVRVAEASVRLKELDVPLRALSAQRVKVLTDAVELTDVRGTALGGVDGRGPAALLVAGGRVRVSDGGDLALTGRIDAAAGAWPDRLPPLDFTTPSARVDVAVRGPFADPTVLVDGEFGRATLYGYTIDDGVARVDINKSRVRIRDGTRARAGRAIVRASGDVQLPSTEGATLLDLQLRVIDAPLATVLGPARLDTTLKGSVGAQARLTGRASQDDTELTISGELSGRGVELYDVRLPAEVEADVKVVVTPRRVQLTRVKLVDPLGGLSVDVSGPIELKAESLDLAVDVAAHDAPRLLPSIPEDLVADRTTFRGRISGPWKNVVVEGDATVDDGRAWGAPFSRVGAHVRVSPKEIRVERGSAIAARGALQQTKPLVLSIGKSMTSFSSGTFLLENADLAAIRTPAGETMPLSGRVTAEATLRGTTVRPQVFVRASAGGLVVADEVLGTARTAFVAARDALSFDRVEIVGPLVTARGTHLRLDTETLRLTGVFDVDDCDLSRITHATDVALRGRGRGVLHVDGDVRAPRIQANLVVRDLSVSGFTFGSGPVAVGLRPDVTPPTAPAARGAVATPALVATVAADTAWELGSYAVRASYAIDRDVIAADIRVQDVDFSVLRPLIGDAVAPLEGSVSGTATASGPLDRLDARVKLHMRDVAARVPALDLPARERLRPLGPVFLDAALDGGRLRGSVCAFPDVTARGADADAPCDDPHRVWAVLGGALAPLRGAWSLLVDANVDMARIEELVPALGTREIGLAGHVRVAARVDKLPEQPATTAVAADVRDLIVRAPGAPSVRLRAPVHVDFADGRAIIAGDAARLGTAREDVEVVIAAGSTIGADELDVSIDGDVALSVLKLFTNEIANAAGIARTHLRISGRFDGGVQIAGSIAPEPGARITPRSLGQPIVFESGRILFDPHPRDPSLLTIRFEAPCDDGRRDDCPLRAAVGEGKVQLRGSVDARTSPAADQTWLQRFDLALSGTGLDVKTSVGRIEAAGDLALTGQAPAPLLRGRVDVTDGLLKRDFQIRNFVLSSTPARPTEPLWQTLTPFGLGELAFDVDVSMQNVRTTARINAFSVDATLRGELRLSRTLKIPAVDGAVEVEEGQVDFPRTRFDILEMQLQFPTSAEGSIKPLVHLAARGEIPPGAAGNDVEVPIDLALDGGFDAMQLDLTAVDPARQWSRTELFAWILFGRPPADTGGSLVGVGVDVASRAALRELVAPVSQELEQLAEGAGLDVSIDVVSGWQLQLGRRLVVEGQGFLSQAVATTDSTTTTTTTGTTGTDALRVRLMLYDHLQLGRSLSAEGRFGVASDLRLSWRLYEE